MRKHDITIEKLLTDLQRQMTLAEQNGQLSAAINAVNSQAKLCGLAAEKVEVKNVSDMDKAELLKQVEDIFGDKAALVTKALGMEEKLPQEPEWPADFPAGGTVQ